MDCLFCSIKEGKIPSKKVYEDDNILAFYDIKPQAPVHIICIPKFHIDSLDKINDGNIEYISYLIKMIPKIAALTGITNGYRIISNCGRDGGQTVDHLHFHLLGGTKLDN